MNAFKEYMNNKTFPFEFDHAMGFFDKAMEDATGIAYLGSACSNLKYSVIKDRGDFNNLQVLKQISIFLTSLFLEIL